MLFSMSKLDTPKYDAFKEAIVKQFGVENIFLSTKEMAKYATEVIQELGIEKIAIVKSESQGITIVFESTVFFDTLSADVTPEGTKILR